LDSCLHGQGVSSGYRGIAEIVAWLSMAPQFLAGKLSAIQTDRLRMDSSTTRLLLQPHCNENKNMENMGFSTKAVAESANRSSIINPDRKTSPWQT
jgi:hypothetical protein